MLQDLVSILDLEMLEVNLFRGQSRDLGGRSVFGGQVVGQGLVSASRTVEDQVAHSVHAYFLRPGDMALPIVYEVDRVRDGRSFTTRRVQAIQNGAPILTMIASFQRSEPGHEHQALMPQVPMPEELEDNHALRQRWADAMPELPQNFRRAFLRELAIEFRYVQPWNPLKPETRPPQQYIWFRACGRLPDKKAQPDYALHRCVLAYASDFNLLGTALLPHGLSWFSRDMICASIDHALWFHRDARADEWLLYSMDTPSAQGGRGYSRGQIFARDGRLVASVAQESLMRDTRLATSNI